MKPPLFPVFADLRRVFIKTVMIVSALAGIPAGAAERPSPSAPVSLAGAWRFQFDPQDAGIKDQWFAKSLDGKIDLPNTTSTAGLGAETTRTDKDMLTLLRPYVGPAWYQRDIEIPAAWAGRPVALHLERVLWRSMVWVNGKPIEQPVDFLSVPHNHDLGVLAPGRHTLTVRIDNRRIYNIGEKGHHYYAGMQTLWNGIIGKIELRPRPVISLARFFPSYKNGTVGVEVTASTPGDMVVTIRNKATGKVAAQATLPSLGRQEVKLQEQPLPWDEFTPNLYTAEVTLGGDSYRSDIGFRDLGTTARHFTINGRPFLYRNSQDGGMFPLTGHPPTDVASWKRILKIYKDHGLNSIRFHSWTPPEAAFTAADELGIYIQSELFWCQLDATPEMIKYTRAEMRAALDHYGNHPSMCFVLYGNELPGDITKLGDWVRADRTYDPRRLYSLSAGVRVAGADDFSEYGAKMNWQTPHTDWDFSRYFTRSQAPGLPKKTDELGQPVARIPWETSTPHPDVTHELGQPATHPDWRELAKYTGVLKPRNLEAFREAARQAGVEEQSAHFQRASGNINRLNYKFDIEGLLRTPESAGYGLLDMHDYPGQGEALIGWLDAFYDEKGFLSAKTFRQYGGATVPLVRLPRFVFSSGDTLNAKAELAHYGNAPLKQVVPRWTLRNATGGTVATGTLAPLDVPVGGVTRFGEFTPVLSTASPRGEQLTLELAVAGFANTWDLWVFPKEPAPTAPAGILIATRLEDALVALRKGGKVLLVADKLGRKGDSMYASFKPPFWSVGMFGPRGSMVSGAVIQDQHPALALFPTKDVMDWQWQPLCSDARDYIEKPSNAYRDSTGGNDAHGFDLKGFPADYRPIVQPVCDFHFPKKIGTVFEVSTRTGGKLLISGYNLLADQVSARQLKRSLLAYMATDRFAPSHPVDEEWLAKTFRDPDAPVVMPAGFENALLYIKAGGRHSTGNGNVNWSAKEDSIAPPDAPVYTVKGASVWADDQGRVWAGFKIHIEITVKAAVSGVLKVKFVDWNRNGRRGLVRSDNEQTETLGAHENGQWVSFQIRREDCLDGKIVIEAESTAGPNLMIEELALIPQ